MEKKSNKKLIIIIVAAVVVIAGIVGAIIAINSGKKDSDEPESTAKAGNLSNAAESALEFLKSEAANGDYMISNATIDMYVENGKLKYEFSGDMEEYSDQFMNDSGLPEGMAMKESDAHYRITTTDGFNFTMQDINSEDYAEAEMTTEAPEGITWNLDDEGTLTISGVGKMDDYSTNIVPWSSYSDSIKKVIIENGVTSISGYAFSECANLTSITIPDSVTEIGDNAFSYCNSLTDITIPDSVTKISNSVFNECNSLTSITIPNGVTEIGEWAFAWCTGLTSIVIPDGVTSIGTLAFNNCESLVSVTIPDSVMSIGDNAFVGCASLTTITIPDGVTSIDMMTFDDCTSLTSITIPNSVTSIGKWAFQSCPSLTDVYYTGSESDRENINIDSSDNDALINATWHYDYNG